VRGADRSPTAAKIRACDEFLDADHGAARLRIPTSWCWPYRWMTARATASARVNWRLPQHALVINCARGRRRPGGAGRRLRSGDYRAGAALDVLDPVPAADDPLWATPNLLITPKVAAYHPGMQADFEAFAEAQQTKQLLPGAPLKRSSAVSRGVRNELRQRHRADPVHR
jgi:hypothetical protein